MSQDTLLKQYVEQHSNAAFEALVSQYTDLVYSMARRRVGDVELARDVTQAVFIILARKAGTIRHGRALSSWLYRTTRFASIDASSWNALLMKTRKDSGRTEAGSAVWKTLNGETDHLIVSQDQQAHFTTLRLRGRRSAISRQTVKAPRRDADGDQRSVRYGPAGRMVWRIWF